MWYNKTPLESESELGTWKLNSAGSMNKQFTKSNFGKQDKASSGQNELIKLDMYSEETYWYIYH